MQFVVWVVKIAGGLQVALTEVIVGAGMVMVAEPDLLVSCTEVAVQLPVPEAAGVKTPPAVIVPLVADQVTAELKAPVPSTVAEQVEV